MMRWPLIICAFSVASAPINAAHAETEDGSQNSALSTSQSTQIHQTALALPLEEVLRALSESTGVSFIFDSRLVRGKLTPPLDDKVSPEEALRQHLQKESLSLHKVNETTFAITQMPTVQPVAPSTVPTSVSTFTGVDTIVVTASALTARANAGARHLFVIDQETLENFATVNPSEAIFELPQVLASFSAANSSFFGSSGGLNLADIRGFGPQRTQVFFNGRRRTFVSGGNEDIIGFDLNAVATPFLQRIEVSSQFGGARLASEAVAGAINFVTKTKVDGFEAGIEAGISEQGDAGEVSIHALGGRGFFEKRGHISVGVNHTRQSGLFASERILTASPFGFSPINTSSQTSQFLRGFGGSPTTQNGLIEGVLTTEGQFLDSFSRSFPDVLTGNNSAKPTADGSSQGAPIGDPTSAEISINGTLELLGASLKNTLKSTSLPEVQLSNNTGFLEFFTGELDQLFNFNTSSHVITPINRTLGFIDVSYDLGPNINLFTDIQLGISITNVEISPPPITRFEGTDPIIGNAFTVNISDPSVPQSVRQSILETFGGNVESIVISRRLTEFGPRLNNNERQFIDATLGAEYNMDENSTLTLHYRFGQTAVFSQTDFGINSDALALASDTLACRSTPGCVPINFFETNGFPQSAVNNIRLPATNRTARISEHEIAMRYRTELPKSINNANVSTGINIRQSIANTHAEERESNFISTFSDTNFSGELTIAEFDIGIGAPVLTKISSIGEINFGAHYRAVVSSEFETAHNVEVDLQWRPYQGITISGNFGYGERTPNINEAFVIGRTRGQFFVDPCTGDQEIVLENCASDTALGVSPNFQQTNFVLPRTTFGNPDLDLETSRNWRAGIIIEPHEFTNSFPGNMTISAVWIDHEINNVVTSPGSIIAECYLSESFSSPSCGSNPQTGAPLIARDPITEQLISNDNLLRNDGAFKWSGLDLELKYATQTNSWPLIDRFWVSGLHTYIDRSIRTFSNGAVIQEADSAAFPGHRSLLSMGVNSGLLDISTLINRRGRARSAVDIPEARIPAVTTADLAIRYQLNKRLTGTVRIENITDRPAPLVAFSSNFNTFPQYYDIIGRRVSIGLRGSF